MSLPVTSKKPSPDLIIRLVGPKMKPWIVGLRRLATVLQAVQRLVEPEAWVGDERDKHDADDQAASVVEPADGVSLTLIDVISGSAAYKVASSNRTCVHRVLSETASSIASPADHDWPENRLSSIADLSEIARTIGCEIELREPSRRGPYGNVLAMIKPTTYADISGAAFVRGFTTVTGYVERVGGAGDMRCALRVPDQPRLVYCDVESEEIVRSLGAHLYRDVIVSGNATWTRHDWRLKSITISSIACTKQRTIMESLAAIREAGGSAWDEVEDPERVIAEMRGR